MKKVSELKLMQLVKPAKAGTYESNDIMIMMFPIKDETKIELESVVFEAFGQQILALMHQVLNQEGITHVHLKAIDKGALDCTIRARLLTAINRGLADD
jgi:citrate lyase subunit gamma (acyl carrier protein)